MRKFSIMISEHPLVEKALKVVFQRENLMIRRIPDKHAGGKWQLKDEASSRLID